MNTRWMAIFDTHGDKIDPGAESAAAEFMRHFKPTIRVHGGDAFDLRWLRRAAGDEERMDDINADIDAGLSLFNWYKPTHVVWGNHDYRLQRALTDATGATRSLASLLVDKISDNLPADCETYEYCKRRGVYQLGDYSVVHGFVSGATAVRNLAATYGNVLSGHIHRVERVQVNGTTDRIGYACGCLCKLDLDYNRASLNTIAQRQGFAYGFLTPAGKCHVFIASPSDGEWIFPTEYASWSATSGLHNSSKNSGRKKVRTGTR